MNNSFYVRRGKRAVDVVLAVLGLLLLSPIFLACSLFIRLSSAGPIFFKQIRSGLRGKPFRIFKFRSMYCAPAGESSLLTSSGDPRVTPVGKWLRKTKLDELPQLLNVVAGDMSLVGPRPEVPRYTALYTEEQKLVLALRPGITGSASIAFSAEEELLAAQVDKERFYVTTLMPLKIDLDLEYCRSIALSTDLRIILQTLLKPLARPALNPARDASETIH